ncbi:MAG: Holliday junction branch migration DNA helicase RuvB, partial [Planctomycetota bacterium]
MATERIITAAAASPEEEAWSWSLRPQRLDEFVGQPELIERLRIAIEAARQRGEPLEHLLLHGPPGLGKTTLAHVVAQEMGARAHVTSGPALTRGADLVGALTKLEPCDVLFIDEIHRLPPAVEEFIYPAMEDQRIDLTVDAGLHARNVSISLKPFTLIGATTRAGLLSPALRSRFGVTHHLRFYDEEDLLRILRRSAGLLGVEAEDEALSRVARRSRGTPRVANRLLRRVRDYAQVRA